MFARAIGNQYQVFPVGGRAYGPVDLYLPDNITAPLLSAETGFAGDRIYCYRGDWLYVADDHYRFQWYRDGIPILNADNYYFDITEYDVFHTLTCAVTGSNSLGVVTVMSSNACFNTEWLLERDGDVLEDRLGSEIEVRA